MTATNHMISGAIIGAYLPWPLALPAAFLSHFVLDAIPHFAVEDEKRDSHFMYKSVVVIDAILTITMVVLMVINHKWLMLLSGIVAFSPDLIWMYKYSRSRSLNMTHGNRFTQVHSNIQKWEKPWGFLPEVVLFYIMLPIFLAQILKK